MNGGFKTGSTSYMGVIIRNDGLFREGMKKNSKLVAYVEKHGYGNWRSIPAKEGHQRYRKSCRLRWINNLKPKIERGNFSFEEDLTIIELHALLGNKWSIIASHLSKQTSNGIMNYWNTNVKRRFIRMDIHSIIHKSKANTFEAYGGDPSKDVIRIKHMM